MTDAPLADGAPLVEERRGDESSLVRCVYCNTQFAPTTLPNDLGLCPNPQCSTNDSNEIYTGADI